MLGELVVGMVLQVFFELGWRHLSQLLLAQVLEVLFSVTCSRTLASFSWKYKTLNLLQYETSA
jgi:hypothetical protein|tara:strand:- start:41 stop:229 length:189 start_codon:yes stop_codon:yes gene_type:complete